MGMLDRYREKRDMAKTTEPSGGDRKGSDLPLFVIHKHDASRLHYDFRLEVAGVLKSWAVPKGPTLDPQVMRLAMMVEDHPFDYKDFEGVIPAGNYGAGKVMIWDQGDYLAVGSTEKGKSDQLILAGLDKGHITFVLNGEKVQGEFALIRINEEKNEWLLAKANDAYAGDLDLERQDYSVVSNRKLAEISGQRIDLSDFPEGKMPEKVRPMLATLSAEPFDDSEWIFEVKWDGYRGISQVKDGKISLYSRNGLSFNDKYPSLIEELAKINHDVILDGEIVVLDRQGQPHFQWLQDYAIKPEGVLVYYLFDILFLDGHVLSGAPLIERKEMLKKIVPESLTLKVSDSIDREGKLFYKEALKMNLEGIMAKKKTSRYFAGKRTKEWLKIKTTKRQEAVIVGFTNPGGGRKYFGSLILAVNSPTGLQYIGNVGSGFDERKLKALHASLKEIEVSETPLSEEVRVPGKHWVKPVLVCEVKFHEWTNEGTLRQPVFLGLRDDKEPEEVVKESDG